jgi:hypothetical protein|tara:strand:- start:322 stop:501 length:180 start_codon:yes stop_codon:yes gene_type:complete
MTLNQFLIKLEQNGISLDESRLHEVNYYYNLWCDTQKQSGKGLMDESGFPAFITWMKKQ